MEELTASTLVEELRDALTVPGEVENWIERRVVGSDQKELIQSTYRQATRQLLSTEPLQTDRWEHVIFATAGRSAASNHRLSREACEAAVDELTQMIGEGQFAETAPEHIVTLSSTLTIVLSAQRRLRQPIEIAARCLCEVFPDLLPAMAERCQDIWQRHGQMSGLVGLFLWDCRKEEWRLNQDFKPYRPT